MGLFEDALAGLNAPQREAVEHIDGPVMVVAGPGTGKTQLLSVRVGTILRKDATMLPSNILCLTFTDAAAANLRERLITKIGLGQQAYQVAIHTFNSFGSWVMATYPDYFFSWREAATADELTSYRIIEALLQKLPGDHPLAGQSFDDSFFALKQVQNFIGDCKRANITPAVARAVLEANQAAYDLYAPVITENWPNKMSDKDAMARIETCITALQNTTVPEPAVSDITTLSTLLLQDLHAAQAEAAQLEGRAKTKPFTAWKNDWLELDADKHWTFKAAKHYPRIYAACDIYEQYQQQLTEQGLVDFNDQIVAVLAALKDNDELRWNLQERFQYIMIDEYQDTNRAQLQMARYLTDAPVHEGRPNILVVGDDDQAIYRFQGADMSNIGAFQDAYREPAIIRLDQNYRSNQAVLGAARGISTQISLSLEKLAGISKELHINVSQTGAGTQLHEFAHETEHYAWIAAEIKRQLEAGAIGKEIAVLARERSQLDALVPYLRDQNVPIDYERRENVLQQEHIVTLLTLARLVHCLSQQQLDEANAILPEVLSHPMWQIAPADIWRVARQAHDSKTRWLDVIFEQEGTRLRAVADFLYGLSQRAASAPLEYVLDELIGLTDQVTVQEELTVSTPDTPSQGSVRAEGFVVAARDALTRGEAPGEPRVSPDHLSGSTTVNIPLRNDETQPVPITSPFKRYYFGEDLFNQQPAQYLTLLSHLACLRRHMRNYQTGAQRVLQLADLVQFTDAYNRAGLTMIDRAAHREDGQAVRLMTAHKAKGQEFDTVFVIGMVNGVWKKVGSNNSRFSYPRNLREIKPSENDDDDALRLLFVAMTRARQNLHITYFKESEEGKAQQLFAPLLALGLAPDTPAAPLDAMALAAQYEQRWLNRHAGVDSASKQAILADRLERYQLSATHFNNFLDVTRGGPLYFLTQNFLNFPSSLSPAAAYGVAVHETLRRAHELIQMDEQPTPIQLIEFFTKRLALQTLSEHDRQQFTHRGQEHLHAFFTKNLADFTADQRAEVSFKDMGVTVGDARLTGSLDVMDLQAASHSITVADYKTGKPFSKWDLPASSPEHDRIKLHRYRQQLLFYKLLVDGSSQWGARGWRATHGVLRFVEPDTYGTFRDIGITYEPEELEYVRRLIIAVWQHIMQLDFPDVSEQYTPNLEGILRFEADLLA